MIPRARKTPQNTVRLFLLGAVIGTAADQIHVKTGILAYRRPSRVLSGQAFWVPLLFGSANVVLTRAYARLFRALEQPHPRRGSAAALGVSLLAYGAAYASTALLQRAPRSLTVLLTLAWGGRIVLAPTRDKILAGPLMALGGPLFETLLSGTGAFRYRRPDFLLVPAWLPALYLHASLTVRDAYLALGTAPLRGRELQRARSR